MLAILFAMNKLFERFILMQLIRAQVDFVDRGLRVEGQASKRFWTSRSIRPDVVAEFTHGVTKERVILDTKWKVPENGLPPDDDLKQMYAYNLHFGSRRSVLLYPRAEKEQNSTRQPFAHSTGLPSDHTHECATYYVDLFDVNQKLR